MKFAICNETFGDWPFDRAFAFARDCGYEGLEIAPFTMGPSADQISAAARQQVRQQAAAADLQIIGLHWLLAKTEGFYLTSPDADVRKRTASYLGDLARLCADLGGHLMVLGSPQQRNLLPGVTKPAATQFAADVISAALPVFESCQVTLAVEPLGPAEGDFLLTAQEGADLIGMVGSPLCRLHLDCKAMSSETEPIPDIIHRHRSLMAHFHANDPNRRGPGMGDLKFEPILEMLGEIDYRGWVSVEVFDYTPGIEALARESIDYLRACLAEIAE